MASRKENNASTGDMVLKDKKRCKGRRICYMALLPSISYFIAVILRKRRTIYVSSNEWKNWGYVNDK